MYFPRAAGSSNSTRRRGFWRGSRPSSPRFTVTVWTGLAVTSSGAGTWAAHSAAAEGTTDPGLLLTTELSAVSSSAQELQAFHDYGESWYHTRKELESRFQPQKPLSEQPEVTAESRCKLVTWLIHVHRHLDLSFESICLTVNILDRFLDTTPVSHDCFQLLGVTALFIACKQVEVELPTINELLALCCNAFSRDQMRRLECVVLKSLNFDVGAPTMSFFLEHFIQVQLEAWSDSKAEVSVTRVLAECFGALSLTDHSFIKYTPSLLAASSLALAKRLLRHPDRLSLQVHGYPEEDLQECIGKLQLLASVQRETLQVLLPLEVAQKCPCLQVLWQPRRTSDNAVTLP